jgi:hypothetical protein
LGGDGGGLKFITYNSQFIIFEIYDIIKIQNIIYK